MNQIKNNVVLREDYQSPNFFVDTIELTFQLHDTETRVSSHMQLRRNPTTDDSALFLNGDDLELLELTLNGRVLAEQDYVLTAEGLLISEVPEKFSLDIVTKINPSANTQLSGLYRSNTMFCTQCEAEGFRRITYFIDRPDVLTKYTTTIVADKEQYPILLSNGNCVERGESSEGMHWVTWNDPFSKPSYLFALVAGDLGFITDTFITQSGREIALQIYTEQGNEDKCQHAMASLKRSMAWDEKVYGLEYDLDTFMIVAVSDFNMGAMENKGLNIFNSKYILVSPETATDQDFAAVENVVAHEYFHNWTGNRVTCRDWFQLSLKEGLTVFRDQEFSRDMYSRDVNRIEDVKVLRNHQFPEDAGPMSHPVRPDSYIEINNFYTATVYNKGAEVIRMQHSILGSEGFRAGMDLYFKRHDGQAVTIDDFVSAMEDANGVDFKQLKRWYSQSGTPKINANLVYDSTQQCAFLHMQQTTADTPNQSNKQALYIPVSTALFDHQGQMFEDSERMLILSEDQQTFRFDNISSKPTASLLRGFSAPVQLEMHSSAEDLMLLMQHESCGFARWEAGQQLAVGLICEDIESDCSSALDAPFLLRAYQAVLDDPVLDTALKAELLTMPSFEDIARAYTQVDVDAIVFARKRYAQWLSQGLYSSFLNVYDALVADSGLEMSSEGQARRKLKNICLFYLMQAPEPSVQARCVHQLEQAENMTDELAALRMIVNYHPSVAQASLEAFYLKWQREALVLDKWLTVQACSPHDNALEEVEHLLSHPCFTLENPNKVRALVGAFCRSNPQQFHRADGRAYRWLESLILKVDPLNPQLAARLAIPLTDWKRYDESRGMALKASLERLLAVENLSPDLYEIVSKSLNY